jgi:hypothetical protein
MTYGATLREQLQEQEISAIMKKFDRRFKVVSEHFTGFTDEQALKLGVLLQNCDEAFNRARCIREATQVGAIGADLKRQYFDILTAFFPQLIAEDLFSVQPIKQKFGQVFFLDYIFGNTKGDVKKGDVAFSHNSIAGYNNYSGEEIQKDVIETADGSKTAFTGSLAWTPIKPGTFKVTAGSVVIVDDGEGNLTSTGIASGGTINYENGSFSFTFNTAPQSGEVIYADYSYNLSYAQSADQIPEMEVRVRDDLIVATPHKLRGTYSLDAAYDLKMAQGIDLNDALLEGCSTQLRHETDGNLILGAYNGATMSITYNKWYDISNPHLKKSDVAENFIASITEGSSKIWDATKRVYANWIVCGTQAADILRIIGKPRFEASLATDAVGPHFAGTLDGKWKVYFDPFLPQDAFLLGYKGSTLLDAGLIYAPYLPFFATETVMLDDFIGRRGFATSYGKKNINNKLYVKGVIIDKDPATLP